MIKYMYRQQIGAYNSMNYMLLVLFKKKMRGEKIMSKNNNNFYYEQEIVALIKSGVEPAEAKKIADAHLAAGNYDKIIKQVADERKQKRKDDEALQRYTSELSARIKGGENPEDVVREMNERER